MLIRTKRAASTLEYVALILIVMAGLIAMSQYVRNAMQGQHKTSGQAFSFGNVDNRVLNASYPN